MTHGCIRNALAKPRSTQLNFDKQLSKTVREIKTLSPNRTNGLSIYGLVISITLNKQQIEINYANLLDLTKRFIVQKTSCFFNADRTRKTFSLHRITANFF